MEKLEDKEQKEVIVNWIRPNLKDERGEIQRVLKEFLDEEASEDNIKKIGGILNNATVVELSEELWESLENTDSFDSINKSNLEEVEKLIEESNRELAPENKRAVGKLLKAFQSGAEIEIPTIIKKGGILHLVSGNTRLMICRALGIKPQVIIGEYN